MSSQSETEVAFVYGGDECGRFAGGGTYRTSDFGKVRKLDDRTLQAQTVEKQNRVNTVAYGEPVDILRYSMRPDLRGVSMEIRMPEIGLYPLIEQLRREIDIASQKAEHSDVRFNIDKVSVELAFQVAVDTKVAGKMRFLVFEAGADEAQSALNSHKIKLDLIPRKETPSGKRDIDINDVDIVEPE